MIQIRNVPPALHRKLKARAASEGLSLEQFLIREASRSLERLTPAQMRRRLARRTRVNPRPSAAEIIRQMRDGK
jgi:antitoxin FitA